MDIIRGVRNNNPLNIRDIGDRFIGEITPSRDPAFKQFATMADGYRAAFLTLGTYNLNGYNTVEKIVNRWAPPTENNTARYISNVVMWSGIPPTQPLTLLSGEEYIRIVRAMSRQEIEQCNEAELHRGFALQNRIRR